MSNRVDQTDSPIITNNCHNGIALLIIDMQTDFVSPASPLCVTGAEGTIPLVRSLLDEARKRSWSIFHVIRRHAADGSDVEPYRRHYFKAGKGICVENSEGSAIVSELAPLPGESIIIKKRFSGFFQTPLEQELRNRHVHTVVVAGTQYPNCVRGTAVDALQRDFEVAVVTDACSAMDNEIVSSNIRDMQRMGIICTPLLNLDSALILAANPVTPDPIQ